MSEKYPNSLIGDGWAPKPRIGDPTAADYKVWGNELINKFLAAGALTAGGGALYHLVHGFNSSQVPNLLRNAAPAREVELADIAAAQAQQKKRRKKKASADSEKTGFDIAELLGRSIPQSWAPAISGPDSAPSHPSINSFHESWRQLYNIAAAGLGGAAGIGLVGHLSKRKRKQDLSDEIDSARKEYFDALTGKSAAELDSLYGRYKQASPDAANQPWWTTAGQNVSGLLSGLGSGVGEFLSSAGSTAADTARAAGDTATRVGQEATTAAHLTALLTSLGAAGVGGMYMYNRTKDRSRAKNLQRAAASRARLREIYQTPWIDPAALDAVAAAGRG